jgi:hypothetical protein
VEYCTWHVSPCLWLDDVSMTSSALLSVILIASNFASFIAKTLLLVWQTDIVKFLLTIWQTVVAKFYWRFGNILIAKQ